MSTPSKMNSTQGASGWSLKSMLTNGFRRVFDLSTKKIDDIENQDGSDSEARDESLVETPPTAVVIDDVLPNDISKALFGSWTMNDFRQVVRSTGGNPDKIVYKDISNEDAAFEYMVFGDWSDSFETFKAIVLADKAGHRPTSNK